MNKRTLEEKIVDYLAYSIFGMGGLWAGIMFFINQPEDKFFFLLHNFLGLVLIFLGIVSLTALILSINKKG